jgi:hypothetical protein
MPKEHAFWVPFLRCFCGISFDLNSLTLQDEDYPCLPFAFATLGVVRWSSDGATVCMSLDGTARGCHHNVAGRDDGGDNDDGTSGRKCHNNHTHNGGCCNHSGR